MELTPEQLGQALGRMDRAAVMVETAKQLSGDPLIIGRLELALLNIEKAKSAING